MLGSDTFSVKILDYYNITVHSLVCNKLSESIMHGATIKITSAVTIFRMKEVERECGPKYKFQSCS
jgi:hypothetical protein